MSTKQINKVIAELNFIKPDTNIEPVVVYSGDSTPQVYNAAYKFIPVAITNGRNTGEEFSVDHQGFEVKMPRIAI